MAPPIACCRAVPPGVAHEKRKASAGSWANKAQAIKPLQKSKKVFFIKSKLINEQSVEACDPSILFQDSLHKSPIDVQLLTSINAFVFHNKLKSSCRRTAASGATATRRRTAGAARTIC